MGQWSESGSMGQGIEEQALAGQEAPGPKEWATSHRRCHGPPLAEGQSSTATRTQSTLSLQWTGLSLSFAQQRWAAPEEVCCPSYSLPLPGLLEQRFSSWKPEDLMSFHPKL
jgi:hypothetical protein